MKMNYYKDSSYQNTEKWKIDSLGACSGYWRSYQIIFFYFILTQLDLSKRIENLRLLKFKNF